MTSLTIIILLAVAWLITAVLAIVIYFRKYQLMRDMEMLLLLTGSTYEDPVKEQRQLFWKNLLTSPSLYLRLSAIVLWICAVVEIGWRSIYRLIEDPFTAVHVRSGIENGYIVLIAAAIVFALVGFTLSQQLQNLSKAFCRLTYVLVELLLMTVLYYLFINPTYCFPIADMYITPSTVLITIDLVVVGSWLWLLPKQSIQPALPRNIKS